MNPLSYRHPMALHIEALYEPKYDKTSLQNLEEYLPETKGLKRAKSYWLKLNKYISNPLVREKIRETYLEEVETVRKMVKAQHETICTETIINRGFFRYPRAPEDRQIPPNFIVLEDYLRIEPLDFASKIEQDALTSFLWLSRKDGKKWDLTAEDLRLIHKICPHKVDRLKTLLWQRHICCMEERQRGLEYVRERTLTYLQNQKPLVIAISVISAFATVTCASVTIIACQPLFLIPTAIAMLSTVLTPSIYYYRRSLYEL